MVSITHPRQVILATSRSHINILGKEQLKDNIITLAWHMPVSFSPQLYAIAVGKTRFSCNLIQQSKVFAVNFIPHSMMEKAELIGSHSGSHTDKFKEAKLIKEECSSIDCPRIKEALGYLECEVIDKVEAGDHIIFIGKVVNSDLKKEDKRLLQGGKKGFTTTLD